MFSVYKEHLEGNVPRVDCGLKTSDNSKRQMSQRGEAPGRFWAVNDQIRPTF